MTLFGNRVVTNVISFDEVPHRSSMGPISNTTIECHVEIEAEMGVMHTQARECQGSQPSLEARG